MWRGEGGGGGPPPLHHGKQVGLYVTCQQLPRTGAVTSQGNKRGAPALWQTSPALPGPAAPGPPVEPPFGAPQLKLQLAVKTKTPVTFRSKLHKRLKNSRALVSFQSMIPLLNKHNKAPQILAATPPSQTCLCARKANCEIRTVWTRVIIVVCGGRACLLTASKTHTDVSSSSDLWLIFQSLAVEREGFTNSSQTEADSG